MRIGVAGWVAYALMHAWHTKKLRCNLVEMWRGRQMKKDLKLP